MKECSTLSVWSLGLCWRSGVLGKHCKSEVLCELLSATGSCSSIAPHSVRHFHAPLATFASNQNTGSGLTSGLTGSKVQLTHSKEERAMFSTCYMGEYAGKSIVVLWVGISRSDRDASSSHGPAGLPPQSYPCSTPFSHGHTEFWGWHKHLGKTLGKEKLKLKRNRWFCWVWWPSGRSFAESLTLKKFCLKFSSKTLMFFKSILGGVSTFI